MPIPYVNEKRKHLQGRVPDAQSTEEVVVHAHLVMSRYQRSCYIVNQTGRGEGALVRTERSEHCWLSMRTHQRAQLLEVPAGCVRGLCWLRMLAVALVNKLQKPHRDLVDRLQNPVHYRREGCARHQRVIA